MKIRTILDQIDLGSLALPKFQRGYVWNREQVRGLIGSLYRKYPVGGLLVWETRTENAEARGPQALQPGCVKLLLDGQQRVTTLYGIIRGKEPEFFEGNKNAFTGLYFNLEEEVFEFYGPIKMKDDPRWISVTELMKDGPGALFQRIFQSPELAARHQEYIDRVNAIHNIQEIDLHIEQITGEKMTVDVVVDIFNRVNSGGTKLSKGDLALAKLCAQWPQAREEMRKCLRRWRKAGFHFRLDWLLRAINSIVTGEALFTALSSVDTDTFRDGLHRSEKAVDNLLNLIAARLGLDHDRVLASRGTFPLMARFVDLRGGSLTDHEERDRMLFWYIHTFLWGRYSGSTESTLNQDLEAIESSDGALTRLVENLRRDRGDLRLLPDDFKGSSRGARFYPLLYMLTRVCSARDWGTGVELSGHLLGYMNQLELHHIFPKSLLYEAGYSRNEVNAIANFTFLTKETNLAVSNRRPSEYLREIAGAKPGLLESHWIPVDPTLWELDRYLDFLTARRELLAAAGNNFLNQLYDGPRPKVDITEDIVAREQRFVPGSVESEEEEQLLLGCNIWVTERGLPEGEFTYELIDPETGEPLAFLDLAWPNGLQEGFSQPVALLIDEVQETLNAANRAGFRFFTEADEFKHYVEREILASPEPELVSAGA